MRDAHYILTAAQTQLEFQDLNFLERVKFYQEMISLLKSLGFDRGFDTDALMLNDAYEFAYLSLIEPPELDYHNREYESDEGC